MSTQTLFYFIQCKTIRLIDIRSQIGVNCRINTKTHQEFLNNCGKNIEFEHKIHHEIHTTDTETVNRIEK